MCLWVFYVCCSGECQIALVGLRPNGLVVALSFECGPQLSVGLRASLVISLRHSLLEPERVWHNILFEVGLPRDVAVAVAFTCSLVRSIHHKSKSVICACVNQCTIHDDLVHIPAVSMVTRSLQYLETRRKIGRDQTTQITE